MTNQQRSRIQLLIIDLAIFITFTFMAKPFRDIVEEFVDPGLFVFDYVPVDDWRLSGFYHKPAMSGPKSSPLKNAVGQRSPRFILRGPQWFTKGANISSLRERMSDTEILALISATAPHTGNINGVPGGCMFEASPTL